MDDVDRWWVDVGLHFPRPRRLLVEHFFFYYIDVKLDHPFRLGERRGGSAVYVDLSIKLCS